VTVDPNMAFQALQEWSASPAYNALDAAHAAQVAESRRRNSINTQKGPFNFSAGSPLWAGAVNMGAVAAGGGLGLGGAAPPPNVTAAGLPTGPASAAGGGVGTMSGGVPAVGASPGVSGGGMSFLDQMQKFSRIPSGGGGGAQQPQQPQGRRFQNATPMISVTPREQLMASRLMRRY